MKDGAWFKHDMKVVLRILEVCQSLQGKLNGWTCVRNRTDLNSGTFKKYIGYLSEKGNIKVSDIGHRHRAIEITPQGINFLKYLKENL